MLVDYDKRSVIKSIALVEHDKRALYLYSSIVRAAGLYPVDLGAIPCRDTIYLHSSMARATILHVEGSRFESLCGYHTRFVQ